MSATADLYRELCEGTLDLIQSVAPDGRILYVNHAWRETLGYSAGDLEAIRIWDVIHPDHLEHCQLAFAEVLAGRPLVDVSFAFRARDGRRVEVVGNTTCRRQGDQVSGTCGFFRDVTRQRDAAQELDRLFNLSLDLLCVAGTDGYFRQVSPAFERVLGYSREELLSRAFLEFVHPDDRDGTLAAVEQLAAGRPVVDFLNRYRARDGGYRWLSWRAAPMPERGLIYAVARDMTEQKRIEERMTRQAQELARSNADLEQFAYAASHDLRAPLRAIGNLADWIEEDLGSETPTGVRKHLALLRSRVARMERLTDDLLRYYRAGHGRETIEPVDTAAMVRELAVLLAPPEGFAVIAMPGLPVLETLRSPLELVLRNLIGNAIKHHDRANGRVEVSAVARDGTHEFCVADDGPGIPEEHQDKIFGVFQTLRPRDQVEGTGIGLALVRRIVERFGGRVWVESREGEGARFHFTWPDRIVFEGNAS